MSRRNIILFAAPVLAVIVLVPLLKALDASQGIMLLCGGLIAVVCGGALGAFMDPVLEPPWYGWGRRMSHLVSHRRRRRQ